MAGKKELVSVNKQLTAMIENLSKLEKGFEATGQDIQKGMVAIDTEAKKALASKKKLTGANKAHREEITLEQKQAQALLKAKEQLRVAASDQAKQILKVNKLKADLIARQKAEIQAGEGAAKTYAQLSARYKLAAKAAKDLAVQHGAGSKKAQEAAATARKYNDELKKIDASMGNHQREVGNYAQGLKSLGKQVLALGTAYLSLQTVVAVFKKIGEAVKGNSQLVNDTLDVMKAKFDATFDAIGRAIAKMDFSNLTADIKAARDAAENYTKAQDELGDTMRSIAIDAAKTKSEVLKLREVYKDTGEDATKRLSAVEAANKKLLALQSRRNEVATKAINSELELVATTLDLNEAEQKLFNSYIVDYGKKEGAYEDFMESNQKLLEKRLALEKEVAAGTIRTAGAYGSTYTTLSREAVAAQKVLSALNANELKSYDKIKAAEDAVGDVQRKRFADALVSLYQQEAATQSLINETTRSTASIKKRIEAEKERNAFKKKDIKDEKITEFDTKETDSIISEIEAELDEEARILQQGLDYQEKLRLEAGKKEIEDAEKKKEELVAAVVQTEALIMGALNFYADQRLELANRAVEEESLKTDAAERNLDRQIELASLGYANNAEDAQKALDLQKASQQAAIEEKKRALEQKQKLEAIEQGTSITTSVANIINGFSTIPIVGWALGAAAGIAMIAAFTKQKKQAKAATQNFGDGGEIDLVGGSHASGNDIHFGNRNGVDLYAEGGEKAAIFNRKATKKYGHEISAFIRDANRLQLEDRGMNAFNLGAIPIRVENNSNFDQGETNDLLRKLVSQNSSSNIFDPINNKQVIREGNKTTTING